MALAAVSIAGCGGSSAGGKSGSATPAAAGAAATVKVTKLPGYGSVLTTASGQALYLLSADPAGGSSCSGSCDAQWPPLTESGALRAGPGVSASRLSAIKRGDGKEQVVYNKHALYTHVGSGATSGAGLAADGGVWYLVSPSGNAVKSTAGGGY
jgi:predicted lipoprotein with Yx(FWY)xxD motif